MKQHAGQWLRERLLDRLLDAAVLGALATGWLCAAAVSLWFRPGPVLWSTSALLLLPGGLFLAAACVKLNRGWRLSDIRKGAHAEETVGQAIEYALTSDSSAVAHHVEDIANVGDIDHLVATPRALWIIETKHARVPRSEFAETLRRIARNVAGVRDWAPEGTRVTGCLVFATKPATTPRPTYAHGAETILCFEDATSLMHHLRDESRRKGRSTELARSVWEIAGLTPS